MRIALITGASSGLGREFALQIPRLYKQLDEIWVIARRTENLKSLENELAIPIRIFDGDLCRDYIYERIEKDLKKCQADIRMLVNAAGYGKIGRFDEIDTTKSLGMITLNCHALTKMTHICLPYIKKGGRIINIASAAAFAPQPGFTVYAATKSYVYSFTLALRRELKKNGIYVTAVCPGPVDTEFFDHTDGEISGVKKEFRVNAYDVVKQALLDSIRKKSVSVYSTSMRAAWVGAKFIPYNLTTLFMERAGNLKR